MYSYNEAIKLNPKDDKAWYNKGIALKNLGNINKQLIG